MDKNIYHPKVFISYSWKSEEYMERVLKLAYRLRAEDGVDVILDRWHLSPGVDKYKWMEDSIFGSDRVLILCEESYKRKADNREGGVGDETIITSIELYGNHNQQKFIPVIMEHPVSIPTYLKSRMAVDYSSNDGYISVLCAAYGVPMNAVPPISNELPEIIERRAFGSQIEPSKVEKAETLNNAKFYNTQEEMPALGQIPDWAGMSNNDIRDLWGIDKDIYITTNYDWGTGFDLDKQLNLGSIDLHLGLDYYTYKPDGLVDVFGLKEDTVVKHHLEKEDRLRLKPGEMILATTLEQLRLSNNIAGFLTGRSSLARLGIMVHCSQAFINPGHRNTLPLQIINLSPREVVLDLSIPICQIILFRLRTPAS